MNVIWFRCICHLKIADTTFVTSSFVALNRILPMLNAWLLPPLSSNIPSISSVLLLSLQVVCRRCCHAIVFIGASHFFYSLVNSISEHFSDIHFFNLSDFPFYFRVNVGVFDPVPCLFLWSLFKKFENIFWHSVDCGGSFLFEARVACYLAVAVWFLVQPSMIYTPFL